MSDNSTGSTGSSSNSWTLLSPEEAAADSAAPVDDGTESLGDAPSLSEDLAGSSHEEGRSHDTEASVVESILSEEGHQVSASSPVCQESSPDVFEEMAASGQAGAELDPEIHAPIIHDTITSSPPDSDLLGAVPFSIATESAFQFSEESVLEEPTEEDITDVFPGQQVPVQESPVPEPEPKITSTPEPFREISPSHKVSEITADLSPAPEISESLSPVLDVHADVNPTPESPPLSPPSEADTGFGSTAESPAPGSPYPATIGSVESEEEEPTFEKEETEQPEKMPDVVREPASDGLRLRHMQPTIVLRRSSDDEDEEEEEFNLPERNEEKRGFSLNQLIVGALLLLCVGSFFFSGFVVDRPADDFDGAELSDQELLDKFAQENKQMNILEAQIESHKEELDRALKMAEVKHSTEKDSLERENSRLKEQLSELPGLREELQILRARVSELTQLTVKEDLSQREPSIDASSTSESVSSGTEKRWDKKEELKRQKILLEESRKRLEGMKNQGWNKHGLRENLVEMQERLLKQVDQLGKREEWKRKHQEHKGEKKEWGRKKEQNHHWKEEKERGKEWKHGKNKRKGDNKDNFRKYNEEWDHKRDERKLEREKRQKDKPWKDKPFKHHHHHHHHQHHHEQEDFWKHQEEKLRRNQHPVEGCHGVDNCADAEGIQPVKLVEFQHLLEVYLGKLEGVHQENKEALRRLTSQFFSDGFFLHDQMLFSEFAEDVADILEDLADDLEDGQHDSDSLEEQMEDFEKDALLKFAVLAA